MAATVNPDAAVQSAADKTADKANLTYNDQDTNPVRVAAAHKKIKAHMRAANKFETTFEMTLVGDLVYIAGTCVTVDKTFGKFAGKYMLDKINHRVARGGQGYQCHVTAHQCLTGY